MRIAILPLILNLTMLISLSACTHQEPSTSRASDPVSTDPAIVDPDFPPAMRELSFDSHGSRLNGLMYIANGPGPHPLVILLHGYAGNERNLDLAQAMRRAGNNVLYFNYRGSWGSGGEFSVEHAIEDAARAIDLTRDPEWATEYRSDPQRVALVGHSFGGFVGAITTANDPTLPCFAFLAGANLGLYGRAAADDAQTRAGLAIAFGSAMDPNGGPIDGDPVRMVNEMIDNAESYALTARAPALATRPLLMIAGSRDQVLAKDIHHDPLVSALKAAGAQRLTETIIDDDHSFSASRVALARTVINWHRSECGSSDSAQL